MAIVLVLAAELVRTISIVVGGRAGRNSSPSRLMRLGLQLLFHRPSLGDCLPSAGRVWTLDGRVDTGAMSCAWNGAARATRPLLWRARCVRRRNSPFQRRRMSEKMTTLT